MTAKRAMTLTLSDAEMKALDELSERKDMTKTAIIRKAIRLYHFVDGKLDDGAKLLFEEGSGKSELMVL